MKIYHPLIKKILFSLFLGCYLFSILCVSDIVPFEHRYHYFFYAGSAFFLMYNFTFLWEVHKNFRSRKYTLSETSTSQDKSK